MTRKKILVLLGHTDKESTCGQFADAYEQGARRAGHEVKRVNIGELAFDPVLHLGYKVIQPLELDLLRLQDDFRWAEHIVLIYPNWWGTMPAILKGLFDRFFLPGFAFNFKKTGAGRDWIPLLKGRTGRVFINMDAPPMMSRILFGDNSNEIRSAIFGFAGIKTRVTKVGPLKKATQDFRDKWVRKIAAMGERGE